MAAVHHMFADRRVGCYIWCVLQRRQHHDAAVRLVLLARRRLSRHVPVERHVHDLHRAHDAQQVGAVGGGADTQAAGGVRRLETVVAAACGELCNAASVAIQGVSRVCVYTQDKRRNSKCRVLHRPIINDVPNTKQLFNKIVQLTFGLEVRGGVDLKCPLIPKVLRTLNAPNGLWFGLLIDVIACAAAE